jgi:hypothetical protein
MSVGVQATQMKTSAATVFIEGAEEATEPNLLCLLTKDLRHGNGSDGQTTRQRATVEIRSDKPLSLVPNQ